MGKAVVARVEWRASRRRMRIRQSAGVSAPRLLYRHPVARVATAYVRCPCHCLKALCPQNSYIIQHGSRPYVFQTTFSTLSWRTMLTAAVLQNPSLWRTWRRTPTVRTFGLFISHCNSHTIIYSQCKRTRAAAETVHEVGQVRTLTTRWRSVRLTSLCTATAPDQ